jgi:DNA-binding beta-propeller fold protein YncE
MQTRTSRLTHALVFTAFTFASFFAGGSLHAQKPFTVQQRWTIGGDGSWDYMTVDSATRRLYIAHQTRVQVVDLDTGKLIGAIQSLTRCHGIVFAPGGKTGFISDGGANAIVVFDPATLAKLGNIPAGTNPDGMVYEPVTHTLWAFNGGSKNATVIDVDKRVAVATVALPGKPEFPATDSEGTVFVNIEDANSVVRLDAKTQKITATWPLAECESPSGLAIDQTGGRLFSVCDGKRMAITDAHSGKSLATPHIGDGPDATAYDATRQLAFSSNEDGTLSVIDTAKPDYPVIQTLPTMNGARTMALDAVTGKVYTVSAKLGATPPPNPAVLHNRPTAIPGSFTVLVIGND